MLISTFIELVISESLLYNTFSIKLQLSHQSFFEFLIFQMSIEMSENLETTEIPSCPYKNLNEIEKMGEFVEIYQILESLIALIILILNLLVITTIFKTRLRNRMIYYIMSLAFCDLFVALVEIPVGFVVSFTLQIA